MNELKPCPLCGAMPTVLRGVNVMCSTLGCLLQENTVSVERWNTRPIEDELRARIAELERDLSNKEIEYTDLWDDALALQDRIAELEEEVVKGGIQIEYLNEDELPKRIPYKVYSAMYPCSKVDFVRLFPYVTVDGRKRFLIELPEVQE